MSTRKFSEKVALQKFRDLYQNDVELMGDGTYKGQNEKHSIRFTCCGYTKSMAWKDFMHPKQDCPQCKKKKRIEKHLSNFQKKHPKVSLKEGEEFHGTQKTHTFYCTECNKSFQDVWSTAFARNIACIYCQPFNPTTVGTRTKSSEKISLGDPPPWEL